MHARRISTVGEENRDMSLMGRNRKYELFVNVTGIKKKRGSFYRVYERFRMKPTYNSPVFYSFLVAGVISRFHMPRLWKSLGTEYGHFSKFSVIKSKKTVRSKRQKNNYAFIVKPRISQSSNICVLVIDGVSCPAIPFPYCCFGCRKQSGKKHILVFVREQQGKKFRVCIELSLKRLIRTRVNRADFV